MKLQKTFYATIGLTLLLTSLMAQQENVTSIKPILLDRSVLSGVGLEKVPIKDEPEKDFFQKNIYRGNQLSVYVVSTETWSNKMTDFPFDEFVYMLHGEALVKPLEGKAQLFHSGDFFFAPKGFTGEWDIRAGNNLHYELSIIATKRAKAEGGSHQLGHKLFDRSTLSGAHIELDSDNRYAEELHKGVELTIALMAEKPTQRLITESKNDQFIHLLSGQLQLEDPEGSQHTFYSGDFLVVPEGFHGKWNSQGHGIIKYLSVVKSDA
ncbi:MAG: DUF861 domain-containing protein [Saprospiraceae bacterium]|nr:DUF861 domain-containing protein [Saprospiraceae bacterium]